MYQLEFVHYCHFIKLKHKLIGYFNFLDNSANGEPQLVVKLEVNGTLFEGVLFANTSSSSSSDFIESPTSRSTSSTNLMNSPNRNTSSIEQHSSHTLISS